MKTWAGISGEMSWIQFFGPVQFSTINYAIEDKESKIIKCENKQTVHFPSKQTHIHFNPLTPFPGPTDSCTHEIMCTRL